MKKIFYQLMLFFVLTAFCGCGLKTPDESSHPLFVRAEKARKANELQLATKYYNRYLGVNPESSKTHLLLASLYDENLDMPLSAVYHYQRFMELAPNSPEVSNVKKWLAAAKKKYYDRTRLEYNDPEDVAALQNTLFTVRQELKKAKFDIGKLKSQQKDLILYARELQEKERKLKAELAALNTAHEKTLNESQIVRKELEQLRAKQEPAKDKAEAKDSGEKTESKVTSKSEAGKNESAADTKAEPETETKTEDEKTISSETTVSATVTPDNGEKPGIEVESTEKPKEETTETAKQEIKPPPFKLPENSVEKTEQDGSETGNQVYTVEHGDSLSSISRRFYGSSRYYKLIFDANRDILQSEAALRPGQVLKIPLRKK